ncbi:MAG TPA: hypothetical protein P5026_13170 [Kiritimatiellia bacterium]|nr:hypothetical protein [Kiritimatiellia bacterium]
MSTRQQLLLSVACGALMSSVEAVTLPDPLIWWTMDEVADGKILDASGNGYDLTLGPGMSLVDSRVSGQALASDRTVNTWGTFACPALTSRTICFWLYRNPADNDSSITSTENKYPYVFAGLSGMSLMFEGTTESFRHSVGQLASAPFIFAGANRIWWSHHAVTLEDTGAKDEATGGAICQWNYYRNGVLVHAKTNLIATGSIEVANPSVIFMNQGTTGNKRPVWGQIDEFRVFNTTLSVEQINAELRRPLDARGPKLIGRWSMDNVTVHEDLSRTVAEETGLSNDMLLGPAVQHVDTPTGKGLFFDGTSSSWAYVATNNFQALLDATIAMWINIPVGAETLNQLIPGNNYPQIFSMSTQARAELQQARDNNSLRVFWHNVTTPRFLDPALAGRDVWSHLAFVFTHRYDAATGRWFQTPHAFINGMLTATGAELEVASDWVLEDPRAHITFGNTNKDAQRPIMGTLSDVSVWDGALSAEKIAELARGPAAVDAGGDFVTTSPTAELRAALDNGDGKVLWTCISGDGASILTPDAAVTKVTLPTGGTYVFRATVTGALRTSHDDVAVTRVAPPAENVPPIVGLAETAAVTLPEPLTLAASVSDPDSQPGALRIKWARVSGPGGVWFEPPFAATTRATFTVSGTYVLACTVSDGDLEATAQTTVTVSEDAASLGLANGLIMSFTGDHGSPRREGVSGELCVNNADYNTTFYVDGKVGYGYKMTGARAYFESTRRMPETVAEGASNTWPADNYRTISAWIYYDTTSTNRVKQPIIFGVPYTFSFALNVADDGTGNGGFSITQQGFKDGTSTSPGWNREFWSAPSVPLANRWANVCVVLDRKYGADMAVYVDGVPCTRTSGAVYGGRVINGNFYIGGWPWLASDPFNQVWGYFPDEEGQELSRTFPGIVDEVRMWNRKLSKAEIRQLAAEPVMMKNRAPQVSVSQIGGTSGKIVRNRPTDFSAAAFDDGLPLGSSLAYEWQVVSGHAADVRFSAQNNAVTQVTVNGMGGVLSASKSRTVN